VTCNYIFTYITGNYGLHLVRGEKWREGSIRNEDESGVVIIDEDGATSQKRSQPIEMEQALSGIGVDNIISVGDDTILVGRNVRFCLCHTGSIQRIMSLQEVYGTGRVIYCPDPMCLISVDSSDAKSDLLILYNDKDELIKLNIDRLLIHLKKKYDEITFIGYNEVTQYEVIQALIKSKFVISIGANRIIAGLIIASMNLFCLINPIFGQYVLCLEDMGLDKLIITASTYAEMKHQFTDIYSNLAFVEETLSSSVPKMRRLAGWVKSYITLYQPSTKPHEKRGTFYIPDSCPLTFHTKSNISGIYLDMCIIKSFLVEVRIHLYPWVGILETSNKNDIMNLFKSPSFLTSISMCRGIFCFTDTSLSYINSLLSTITSGRNIITKKISIPCDTCDTHDNRFDTDIWLNHMSAVNLESGQPIYIKIGESSNGCTSILIVTSLSPPLLGDIIKAVAHGQPIILRKSEVAVSILGDTYPLYIDNITPGLIMSFMLRPLDVLKKDVEDAVNHINTIAPSFKSSSEMLAEIESRLNK
jgi:hypothetical protein